jgi:murein DD-endopeptidase MepM/ murein hydrolase activator NlpD
MPASGRRIRTFSISMQSLVSILVTLAIVITSAFFVGSLLTWRYCRKQGQIASEAVQNSEALQIEFARQLQEIRKSYSDFRIILGIDEEELDDKAGKGGPKMPELPDGFDMDSSPALDNIDDLPTEVSSLLKEAASLKSNLNGLTGVMGDRMSELATTPSIWPVKFEPREQLWISSGFGRRKDPFTGRWTMHTGVDVPAPRRTPVISTADGVITKTGKDAYLGNYIEIRHGDKFSTLYGHMDRYAKGVKRGTKVKRGDVIGYVGRTGRTTGSHVHYEVRFCGERVNPKDYILN